MRPTTSPRGEHLRILVISETGTLSNISNIVGFVLDLVSLSDHFMDIKSVLISIFCTEYPHEFKAHPYLTLLISAVWFTRRSVQCNMQSLSGVNEL